MNKIPIETFQGIFPASLTMFDSEGNLDEKATWNHANWLINQGVHGLIATGTSGEFMALKDDERKRVITIVRDAAKDRVPMIAGTGYYSTRQTIEMTQYAQEAGLDGALVILPYYMKPPKWAVMEHFRLLRRNVEIPILVYNNPAYAGCEELTPWEMAELASEGVLQGVKSTMATTAPVTDLTMLCPPEFRIFYGSFREALQGFSAGAHGWISGILNFLPAQAVMLYQAIVMEKDLPKAQGIWEKIVPFVQHYFHPKHGPAPDLSLWRAGLDLLGLHGGFSRPPFFPLTQDQRADMADVMKQVGLLPE
jgi:4-hydroxy-tetrahydrodipicolinate synthase